MDPMSDRKLDAYAVVEESKYMFDARHTERALLTIQGKNAMKCILYADLVN